MELDHGWKEIDCGKQRDVEDGATWWVIKSYEPGQSYKKGTKKEGHVRNKINSHKRPKTRWQRSSMPVFSRGKCQLVSWATQSSAAWFSSGRSGLRSEEFVFFSHCHRAWQLSVVRFIRLAMAFQAGRDLESIFQRMSVMSSAGGHGRFRWSTMAGSSGLGLECVDAGTGI